MRDYIQLQFDYLLSKITVIIIFLLMTVIIVSSIYNAQIIEFYGYLDSFRSEFAHDFLNETFIIIEFILVFLSIYIGMVLAGNKNQAMMLYSVYSKRTKYYYLLSRIVVAFIILTFMVLWVSLSILLMVYYFTPYHLDINTYCAIFILLVLELMQYFMLTIILMGFINHFLFGLIPLLIFWLFEILSHDIPDNTRQILDKIMINITGYNYQEKNILIFLIIFHFLTIHYIIVMRKKDC